MNSWELPLRVQVYIDTVCVCGGGSLAEHHRGLHGLIMVIYGNVAQRLEHLPTMQKAPGSMPSAT